MNDILLAPTCLALSLCASSSGMKSLQICMEGMPCTTVASSSLG